MELKKGYKQTEVGVIPEDWEVAPFNQIAAIRKQKINPRLSPCDFCIELEHISQNTGRLLANTETCADSSIKAVFKERDVLFGKLRAYLRKYWLATKDGVCSTEIWPFVANPSCMSAEYLFQLVRTNSFIGAASTSFGTHMPRSDWDFLKSFLIPIPTDKAEQGTIAEALSDADDLIESLDKLIAKSGISSRRLCSSC